MWKMGGSTPFGQAHFWQPNRPQCAKNHAARQPLSSRAEKSRTFLKNRFYIFDHFFLFVGDFLRFARCWPYVEVVIFGGFSGTRVTK